MKSARRVLAAAAAIACAVLAARAASSIASDVRRYDRMRKMSGQGPMVRELPAMFRAIRRNERGVPLMIARTLVGLPKDAAHYVRLRSM